MTSNAAFKNKVRALAEQEGIPYAEARSRLLGATGPGNDARHDSGTNAITDLPLDELTMMIGRALITRVLEIGAADAKAKAETDAWAQARESEGLRVVSTSDEYGSAFGIEGHEVRDYRTGETLATGLSFHNELNQRNGWIDASAAVADGSVSDSPDYETTEAFNALPDDADPQLWSFVERVLSATDYEPWFGEFAKWIGTTTSS